MKLGLGQALGLGKAGAAGAPPEPGPTVYRFTIDPAQWTYDAGFGDGPQVTHSIADWSGGLYAQFCDINNNTIFTLLFPGASYEPGTLVENPAQFVAAINTQLDTVDAGLTFAAPNEFPDKWELTFTAPPEVGTVPIVYLNFYVDAGASPSFTNPIDLVTING